MKIGILGGGQLGRMLALGGYPLGFQFRLLDPNPEACGGQVAELMDDPDCDPERLEATLRRFGAVNRLFSGWGGTYRSRLRPHLASLGRPARVLDLGSGGGDLVLRLAGLATRDGFDVEWIGADPDPRAVAVARERSTPRTTFRCWSRDSDRRWFACPDPNGGPA